MSQNKVYGLLKKSMNVTVEANKVIANNIANVNIKNYKRYYVPFEQVMEESTANGNLKTTNEKHIGIGSRKRWETLCKKDCYVSRELKGSLQ